MDAKLRLKRKRSNSSTEERESERTSTEVSLGSYSRHEEHTDGATPSSTKNSTGTCSTPLPEWKKITAENLNVDYCILYDESKANCLLDRLEQDITWNTGREAQVKVFGKWHDIPRKQAAYGDEGLSYAFSGTTVQAKPWVPLLSEIRDQLSAVTGHYFNFVLINRYKDGNDHVGEHKDDEKDMVQRSPIASLSLGQVRDFIFKHGDSRGKDRVRNVDVVKLKLEHGSLLMMNYPTNRYWYHALPVRKGASGLRINLTFRDFVVEH